MRSPCDESIDLKKGPWTPEEDQKLTDYIAKNGHGNWRSLPKLAGLNRCGKSCRLRWTNYLRPDIKRGKFSEEEERIIINLHSVLGNKWSRIATHLPGRTDNEIKNFWNTYLRKKLLNMGIDPNTHKPRTDLNHLLNLSQLLTTSSQLSNLMNMNSTGPWDNALKLQADATAQLAKFQLLQNLLQAMNNTNFNTSIATSFPNIENIYNISNTTSLLGGSQNPNPFEGFVNNGPSNQIQNMGVNAHNGTYNEDLAPNPWASLDHDEEMKKSLKSTCHDHEGNRENNPQLPGLVSASPATSSGPKISDLTSFSPQQSPSSSVFEAWEKLMDDETSESYWKDILE
ncbi:hypothetical protein UlMin_001184 [Ulmus minor]